MNDPYKTPEVQTAPKNPSSATAVLAQYGIAGAFIGYSIYKLITVSGGWEQLLKTYESLSGQPLYPTAYLVQPAAFFVLIISGLACGLYLATRSKRYRVQ